MSEVDGIVEMTENEDLCDTSEPPATFKLKATKAFEDRGKSVFGSLPDVTLRCEEVPPVIATTSCYILDEDLIGQGKPGTSRKRAYSDPLEYPFKRPRIPIMRGKRGHIPDYQRNPERWTKYSVADSDMSENANTSAAFSFLREMDERKAVQTIEESSSKIVFKKPRKVKEAVDNQASTTAHESTKKHVMAAFEFGKKKEAKKVDKVKVLQASELKLSHLADEEE